jgi:polygalacturonase
VTDQIIAASAADATITIQAAIDAAATQRGGRIVLQAGTHRVGGLRLMSRVELHLEAGAVLLLAASYDAYARNQVSVIAEGSDRTCIVGQGLIDCAITGAGTIRAPGAAYVAGEDPEVGTHVPATLRPRVLVLEDCEQVTLSGVRIEDSPMWTVHLVACHGVRIDGISIANDRLLPNTDGIVVDSCTDVVIENVAIDTADDGVCLKTTRRAAGIAACRDVVVRNSRVSSQSCALKIGTETFGEVSDISFEDCVVTHSNRALGIFSRDGGRIFDVRYARITVDCHETPDGFWGSGEAITVTVVTRRPELPAGAVSNVTFEDITGDMEGAINLVSAVPAGISDVRLSRVSLAQHRGALGTAERYDLRPTPADLAPPPSASGRPNAWTKGADGVVVGLAVYPGGMPGLFSSGVHSLSLEVVVITRPVELPAGWNPEIIVQA